MKKVLLILFALSFVAASCDVQQQSSINSYADCANSPGALMKPTYPEQCVTEEGKVFVNPDQTNPTPPSSGDSDSSTQPNPDNSAIAKIPTQPITTNPTQPVSVKYLIEHRLALNNQTVTVKGIIINAQLGDCGGSGGNGTVQPMYCMQPTIVLADSASASRDMSYDLNIFVNESETGYKVGQTVTVTVVVAASADSLIVTKKY